MNLQLKAEGEILTGTMLTPIGSNSIVDGKITGDTFVFNLNIIGNMVHHQGKLEGNNITLTSNFQGQDKIITLTRVQ